VVLVIFCVLRVALRKNNDGDDAAYQVSPVSLVDESKHSFSEK
jgi:hypothetical protein